MEFCLNVRVDSNGAGVPEQKMPESVQMGTIILVDSSSLTRSIRSNQIQSFGFKVVAFSTVSNIVEVPDGKVKLSSALPLFECSG